MPILLPYTLEKAITGFKEAAARWAAGIKAHYVARKHTKLTGVVSRKEREIFKAVVSITETGHYTLTATFTAAVARIESAARTQRQQAQQTREQRQQQRQAQRPRQG